MDTGTTNWSSSGGYYIGGAGLAIDSSSNIYYGTHNGASIGTHYDSFVFYNYSYTYPGWLEGGAFQYRKNHTINASSSITGYQVPFLLYNGIGVALIPKAASTSIKRSIEQEVKQLHWQVGEAIQYDQNVVENLASEDVDPTIFFEKVKNWNFQERLACEKVISIDSDHSPFFSRPKELIKTLLEL